MTKKEIVAIRLTAEEKKTAVRKANDLGLTLSEYFRYCALETFEQKLERSLEQHTQTITRFHDRKSAELYMELKRLWEGA